MFSAFVITLLTAAGVACGTTGETRSPTAREAAGMEGQVMEIMPGMLKGYLTKEEQLDSKAFVLPSPPAESAMQAMDTAWADQMQMLRGTDRYEPTTSDADLAFPAAVGTLSCALGIPVGEEDTPALYMLLRRTLTDIVLAPHSAKNAYQRERPFMVRG